MARPVKVRIDEAYIRLAASGMPRCAANDCVEGVTESLTLSRMMPFH